MTALDAASATRLTQLLRATRIAHLATLRQGAPFASMTPFLADSDPARFLVHVSALAWHTQDMRTDARVALSVAEADDGREDPYALARLTVRGVAAPLDDAGGALRARWLAHYPATAINFELADFGFWAIEARDARFIAGAGRIHNLSAAQLAAALRA